ncbi:30S ribosomal protein S13 [Candidatus Carsonella ruddii]|uniref:30S ribosomal protein S13 n=1 Tax=Carsonella ruddii TaxID=114186 RepID=UPI003D47E8EA
MNINILGVYININTNILFGLTKIYGIGLKTSNKIFNKLNIDKKKKFFQLNEKEKQNLLNIVKNIVIENDLRLLIKENLKRIIFLNNYKSLRHKKKLPCNGQKTKTNAKTRKKMNHENI